MPRCRRAGVKLPPSGKITNASFSSRPCASSSMWRSRSPPRGSMNRAGSRLSTTSIAGSQARVSLSTTRGSRWYQCISAWISVNESPGPACRHATRIGTPGWASGRRTVGLDPQRQHPPGLPEEHPHHALHQVVVDALEVRRPHPAAEARGEPQPEQHQQQQRLAGQVEDHDPQQPQRPPPARQHRRQHAPRRSARPAASTHSSAVSTTTTAGDQRTSDRPQHGGHGPELSVKPAR